MQSVSWKVARKKMAEKWQQWMPLDVNDWRGSPFVRALPAAARSGYLDLILAQWDSEDCSLSSDPLDLAEASFLTTAEWAEFGARILRKFQALDNGRLRNQVCFEKWEKARAMFYKTHKPIEEVSQARSEAGKAGNLKRWGLVANESQLRSNLSQTDRKTSQTVHIQNKDKEQRLPRTKAGPSAECVKLYAAYPRRIAPDAAYRAITKALSKTSFADLLLAVERFATQCQRNATEPQFIPHPATWFNQGRYNDEPQPDFIQSRGAPNARTNQNLEALRIALADEPDQNSTHSGGDDARSEVGRRHDQTLFRSLSSRAV